MSVVYSNARPQGSFKNARNYKPTRELLPVLDAKKIPLVYFAHAGINGAVLYVCSELHG